MIEFMFTKINYYIDQNFKNLYLIYYVWTKSLKTLNCYFMNLNSIKFYFDFISLIEHKIFDFYVSFILDYIKLSYSNDFMNQMFVSIIKYLPH